MVAEARINLAIAISFCEMTIAKIGVGNDLPELCLSIVEMLFCVRTKVYIFKYVLDHIKINKIHGGFQKCVHCS